MSDDEKKYPSGYYETPDGDVFHALAAPGGMSQETMDALSNIVQHITRHKKAGLPVTDTDRANLPPLDQPTRCTEGDHRTCKGLQWQNERLWSCAECGQEHHVPAAKADEGDSDAGLPSGGQEP